MKTSDGFWIHEAQNNLVTIFALEFISRERLWGYEIKKKIEILMKKELFTFELNFSTLYTILRRLENEKHFIKTVDCGKDNSLDNSRNKRCYELTKLGEQELTNAKEQLTKLSTIITSFLGK